MGSSESLWRSGSGGALGDLTSATAAKMRHCPGGKSIYDGGNTGRRYHITLDVNSINEGDTGRQRWVLAPPLMLAATHGCDGPPQMETRDTGK